MVDSYVIAIDFGTAYSGYAFSVTSRQADIDPQLKFWGHEFGLETPKAPTCILFDEEEKFLMFGYEANRAYVNMRGEEARNKFFFECFKMSLYGRRLNRDMTITAANGDSMKALKVFSAALRYMKEDALKTIADNTAGKKYIASDFTWVLTVPAIWDPSAKQFMTEAAIEAGIVTKGKEHKLVIALEPEAASIWCKKLPANGFIAQKQGEDALDESPGTKYIVVDCGGGTVDITVHEILQGGKLKELHKASGNDMGGQTVDKKFKDFLREIFTGDVWDCYVKQHPGELQRLMYDFSVYKKKDDNAGISIPYNLGTLVQKSPNVKKFWKEGSIEISKDKMRSFFDESLRRIATSVKEILNKGLKIHFILLVGGYAESPVLRQHIISEFGHQCKVLCPFRPQEAIVKGAAMFGRTPEVVASRKSAFTYGIAMSEAFVPSKHREDKKSTNKNGVWCDDLFKQMVEIDEDVAWDESREHIWYPVESDQTSMRFRFFCTERRNVKYVDEWGMEQIGSFVVNMPDTRRGMSRQVKLKIRFGYTEMKATATDLDSMSVESIKLDFMRKS